MEDPFSRPEIEPVKSIRKVVLTGGPCGGKSSVFETLQAEFSEIALFVPEAATILMKGGYPGPPNGEWSPQWQRHFQRAVTATQFALEDYYEAEARTCDIDLLVCDRGLLDGAVYLPGGLVEFEADFDVEQADLMNRYDNVIHLESLATADPASFSAGNNGTRYESVSEAQDCERRTREAWSGHSAWQIVDGADLDRKIQAVRVQVMEWAA